MFESISLQLERDLGEVKSVARWHDSLRKLLADGVLPSGVAVDAPTLAALNQLAPGAHVWRTFDHCAAVSRIYALFEGALCALVTEYLRLLPTLVATYGALSEEIRSQHRVGTAHILSKWGPEKSSYSKLAENVLAAGLADGIRGQPYDFLAEAFLTDSDNFRADTINRIFGKIGFSNAFSAVNKNQDLEDFSTARLDNASAESYLNAFVKLRNEAAHGEVSNVATTDDLANYSDFVLLVHAALSKLLTSRSIKYGLDVGKSIQTGIIIKRFSNNIFGVSGSVAHAVSKGDLFYAGDKYLQRVRVLDIAVNKTKFEQLSVDAGVEFGLMLDRRVPEGAALYRWL